MSEDRSRDAAMQQVSRALEDPDWGRRNLGVIVDHLEHGEPTVRTGAGWAVTLVADEHSSTVPTLVDELRGRMQDGDAGLALERALESIAMGYPEVREGNGTAFSAGSAQRQLVTGANADSHGRSDPVTDASHSSGWQAPLPETWGPKGTAGESDGPPAGSGPPDDDDGASPGAADPADGIAGTDLLERIVPASQFEELVPTDGPTRDRYGYAYRMRGTIAGTELPVGLVLFHRPEDPAEFGASIDAALSQWATVSDHANVLTLQDWGLEPRPWALTEYAAESLVGSEARGLEDVAWAGERLATALACAHERGVVHAGIDPGNVVSYGNRLGIEGRREPLVTNPAVLTAVRNHFDPTGSIDPRYAAPEYYERRYGRVDHATDIYQLGAVLYRAATGEHPFDGEYGAVREAILSGERPVPSDVVDAPTALDDVVGKAMAKEKLRRYQSVSHMAADLRDLGAGADAG